MKWSLVLFSLFAGLAQAEISAQQQQFFQRLSALCGQTLSGKIVTDLPAGSNTFGGANLVVKIAECSEHEIRMPLAVGEDHSRTWILHKTAQGLAFHHEHRHADGTLDNVTGYGGLASTASASRNLFPADAATKTLFQREGLEQSLENTWLFAVTDNGINYGLQRPGREVVVTFVNTDGK